MTAFDDIAGKAAELIREATAETRGMREGVMPSILSMSGIQADLVECYYRIGELLSESFTDKERANIERKVSAARAHLKGRNDFQMTQEDARQHATESVKELYGAELEKVSLYEHAKILRDSISQAINHLTQTISTVKYLEGHPTPSHT